MQDFLRLVCGQLVVCEELAVDVASVPHFYPKSTGNTFFILLFHAAELPQD